MVTDDTGFPGPRSSAGRSGRGDLGAAGRLRMTGGDEGNRTPNPRLAKAVLCQLSYVPGGLVCATQEADGVLTA